jgi:preprotein translocase subunit SecY
MSLFMKIVQNLPEISGPKQRRLSFKEKLKWTTIVLFLFFTMGIIQLFGLDPSTAELYRSFSILLGAQIGSIISLGIGPLVTSSIVLQLLNGSGIVNFDLTSSEGKKKFQGIQKILALFFVIFEAFVYVFLGGLAPVAELQGTPLFFQLQLLLVLQLAVGGFLIMLMDEIISKWGFGSGISLFIAANVSQSLFVQALSWTRSVNSPDSYVGAIPELFRSVFVGDVATAGLMLASILATIGVFAMVVYTQSMKVEIPLSFGRVRGHGIRWPLSFMYTSNIPVILVAALIANLNLLARFIQGKAGSSGIIAWISQNIIGQFSGNSPTGGLVSFLTPPNLVNGIITGSLQLSDIFTALGYSIVMIIGCVIFSYFWVQTAGMDAGSQAKQIMSSGLQIPGFRRDQRVLERLLDRYIDPLTIMGGITVGMLAALADVSGALVSGTGLLLTVMIVYRLYEEIAKQHMMDMHPMMRKFME